MSKSKSKKKQGIIESLDITLNPKYTAIYAAVIIVVLSLISVFGCIAYNNNHKTPEEIIAGLWEATKEDGTVDIMVFTDDGGFGITTSESSAFGYYGTWKKYHTKDNVTQIEVTVEIEENEYKSFIYYLEKLDGKDCIYTIGQSEIEYFFKVADKKELEEYESQYYEAIK